VDALRVRPLHQIHTTSLLTRTRVCYLQHAEQGNCQNPTGAKAGTLNYVNMTAQTRQFDQTIASDTGDFWLASTNPSTPFSPIVIKPGQSAVINVTITPSGPKNTKVAGVLYVDDFINGLPPYGQFSGDELAGLPYAYMIK
jgi:hypothetical protein